MSFIYSCIGDNVPENREHLEKIGYVRGFFNIPNRGYIKTINPGIYNLTNIIQPLTEYINCIGNPALFQAVTAMREDSDYMQWFVTEADQAWVNQGIYAPKGSFELCLIEDRYAGQDPRFCSSIVPAHKATLEELKEHFKHV